MEIKLKIMKITTKQFGYTLALVCLLIILAIAANCQDTLRVNKVKVPYNVLVNKSGQVTKVWYRKVKVPCGYITRVKGDVWMVNGKEVTLKS